MHDLVIRGGLIIDGSGQPSKTGDIAIDNGRITATSGKAGLAAQSLDADGLIVTPGWVDIHTHYDGQATWDPYITPSSWHGVTTVVMGNCGVGFSPVKQSQRSWLIGLMEGVEDIPGSALAEGIQWEWESFPEYLDALESKYRAIDIGTQVPHGAVRAYVMGERGAQNEPAQPQDLKDMGAIVEEGIRAGGLGFTTSRTVLHRSIDGQPVPGTYANEAELFAMGQALARAGSGVFEMASDLMPEKSEIDWARRLSKSTGRPITFALVENDFDPDHWHRALSLAESANADGARIVPQVHGRPTGLLLGFDCSLHPFLSHETYKKFSHLQAQERLAKLKDPSIKRSILKEESSHAPPLETYIYQSFHKLFPLGQPPDYEPTADMSVAAIASRERRPPKEVAYDLLLEKDGRALLYFPLFGYTHLDFESIREMLIHPQTILGLSDGGAHCGAISDASTPTFMLTHWTRDRKRGKQLPLEWIVKQQTRATAELYGLFDRGLLAPGMKADINLIDYDNLTLHTPEIAFDLPGDTRRIVQRSEGYIATMVNGKLTYTKGEATGSLPGRLIRGEQGKCPSRSSQV